MDIDKKVIFYFDLGSIIYLYLQELIDVVDCCPASSMILLAFRSQLLSSRIIRGYIPRKEVILH